MPIEIRELVIRAEVNTKPDYSEPSIADDELKEALKLEIIDACMFQVKEIIQQSNQR